MGIDTDDGKIMGKWEIQKKKKTAER